MTSCGLNDEPLKAEGEYPSIIACNITNVHMSHGSNSIYTFPFPNVTNIGDERFIAEVENETLIGYKYFKFNGTKNISVTIRKETENNKVKLEAPKRTDERCDAEVKRCTSFKDNEKITEKSYIDILKEEKGKYIERISIPDNLEGK